MFCTALISHAVLIVWPARIKGLIMQLKFLGSFMI
jgi:hypothetical protein